MNNKIKNIKENIDQGKVIKGMNTREASLAGGAYFYRVIADEDVWDTDTDPTIIKTQVTKPDNSQIWMTFPRSQVPLGNAYM